MYRVACRYALTRFLNVISQAETSLKAPKSARKRHELFPKDVVGQSRLLHELYEGAPSPDPPISLVPGH